jgi:hypothetical protein
MKKRFLVISCEDFTRYFILFKVTLTNNSFDLKKFLRDGEI